MQKLQIYNDLAKYYDLLYESRGKNYQKEVTKIESIIKNNKISKGKKLLDVGCGMRNR